jgi:RNA polymerase sigma-70 factor (family 1)
MQTGKFLYASYSDEELFELVKANDSAAFETLYKRYWPVLVNAAYKRLDSIQKAEDIVQTIFIDVYQRRGEIELNFSLKTYLNQALKFKVLNEYRSEAMQEKYRSSIFFYESSKNVLAEELEAKELCSKLYRILDQLPEKCRQVFLLSRKENKSNTDISRYLNISVSTVEKHISKALKSFKGQLRERTRRGNSGSEVSTTTIPSAGKL